MIDLDRAYMNTAEVSKYLNIAAGTLVQWRFRQHYLPYHKMGNLVRYRTEDVKAFAEADCRAVTKVSA
jgi:excisionase family DNA binding protein